MKTLVQTKRQIDRPSGWCTGAPSCKLRSELTKLQKKLAAAHQEMLKSRLVVWYGGEKWGEGAHPCLSDVLDSEQVKRFPTMEC